MMVPQAFAKINGWLKKPLAVPFAFLMIAIVSYGFLINRLGYYWDDFPITYIYNIFGSAGLERYFSTNRPIWGLLYQVFYTLFDQPWQWQVSALFWRWISAVLVWLLLREVWPKQKTIALWAGLLFLVYPGFKQQHISVIYSNLFIVLDCFLLSLYFTIKSLPRMNSTPSKWQGWLGHTAALLLSLFNLLALEYFFTLELLRPLFIWFSLSAENLDKSKRAKITFINWLPYLVLWIGVILWRIFFFSYQTHNYQLLFLESLRESPLQAILWLIKDIGQSIWVVLVGGWVKLFELPDIAQLGIRTTLVTIILIVIIAIILIWYLITNHGESLDRDSSKAALTVGAIALLLGGIPWWLTQLPPTLKFPSDRFTLPFILGVCLLLAGFLAILPIRGWMKAVILATLIGLAAGSQFQASNQFRRDWETQKRFFWQLAWRVPGLEPGTTLMVNELPVTYYSDNSLTAPLNWFWAPNNTTQEMA